MVIKEAEDFGIDEKIKKMYAKRERWDKRIINIPIHKGFRRVEVIVAFQLKQNKIFNNLKEF